MPFSIARTGPTVGFLSGRPYYPAPIWLSAQPDFDAYFASVKRLSRSRSGVKLCFGAQYPEPNLPYSPRLVFAFESVRAGMPPQKRRRENFIQPTALNIAG